MVRDHDGRIFFVGNDKATVPAPAFPQNVFKDIDASIDVLAKEARTREMPVKVFFDQHNIDDSKHAPARRQKHFQRCVIGRNLLRVFPETATIGVESRDSLNMQAADWVCGIVARVLGAHLEPKERGRWGKVLSNRARTDFSACLISDSHLRTDRLNRLKALFTWPDQGELDFEAP